MKKRKVKYIEEPIGKIEIIEDFLPVSKDLIHKSNSIILDNQDRDAFLEALQNPPLPNKALKKAFSHHQRFVKNGDLRECWV